MADRADKGAPLAAAEEEARKRLGLRLKKEELGEMEKLAPEKAKAKKQPEAQKAPPVDWTKTVLKLIEKRFPELPKNLKRADMRVDATSFVARALMLAFAASTVMGLSGAMLASTLNLPQTLVLLAVPVVFMGIFMWMMQYPKVRIAQRERELDKDVLFAGRDMLIAVKSGVPLFNAMANVSKNYGIASEEFAKIVERIQGGMPAEIAMQESSDMNTSKPFRQILLQMITSMRSGADVAVALEIVLSQISQEQIIALKRYGQKLNPITMFYMLFGIILPSLGIAIGIILTSFVNIKLDFGMLLVVLMLLGVLQYIFLAMMRSSRPNFEV